MLVLIDESGCSGFKLSRGSTPIFCAAMVVFADYAEAEKVSAIIKEARESRGVKPEFKFSNCSHAVRDAFFDAVTKYNFVVRAIVVEKEKIYSPLLRSQKETFYNFFVQSLMKHDNDLLETANVKIDGSGDRVFKKELNAYLRHQLGPGKLKKVRFVDSKSDNLVQLADMCVGAVARSYRPDLKYSDRWRNMLTPRIGDIWEFK